MKKLFALLLAVVMVLGLVACAQPEQPTTPPTTTQKPTNNTTSGGDDTTAGQDSYFPLKEETTLKIAINVTNSSRGLDEIAKGLETNVLWNELLEKTNVKVELIGWTKETITAMFANDELGDIVLAGGSGNDNLFGPLANEGVITALNEYIDNPEITPNMAATIWKELPEARATFANPDGNVYLMGEFTMDKKVEVEGYLWVYKPWLDAAGMDVPTTLEEYEAFLEYVNTHDMNGNGKEDEVGVYFAQGANNGIESWLGLYGLPTKDGTYENYVTLKDGTDEAMFIPQMEEWKDFLKLIAGWYEKGYIHEGIFTDSMSNYGYVYMTSKTKEVLVASMYVANPGSSWRDGKNYVVMNPIQLSDAPVRWYINPAYMGSKCSWCIPAASENAELAVRFMDLFYDPEVTIRATYGEEDSPFRTTLDDGTFFANVVDANLQEQLYFTEDSALKTQLLNVPKAWTYDGLAKIQLNAADEQMANAYELYKDVINKTVWPRPYIPAEDQARLTELRTDIFNLVNEKRADWVTGVGDIDAEWEQFQEDLIDCGIEEFMEIMQNAYDVWYESYSKAAG